MPAMPSATWPRAPSAARGRVRIAADLGSLGASPGADRGGARGRSGLARRGAAPSGGANSARHPPNPGPRRPGKRDFCSTGAFHRIISGRPLAPISNRTEELEAASLSERGGCTPRLPGILPRARPYRRALELARARQRSDAAVHQCRHGAVQGRVPRQGPARLRARRFQPALRARRRQAQRPRERRLYRPPPHVLRDARQLLLRRLLQARGDPLRLGVPDRRRCGSIRRGSG